MKFFKSEITRFVALGFAGGAALVLGTFGIGAATKIADGIVPPAHAEVQR